jgi:hypothetical protein
MIQEITIKSDSSVNLKPLIEAAIRGELKVLTHGIKRTRAKLAEFEQQFGMSSDEFEQKFANAELNESLDFIEWFGEIKTLRLLSQQQNALEQAEIA